MGLLENIATFLGLPLNLNSAKPVPLLVRLQSEFEQHVVTPVKEYITENLPVLDDIVSSLPSISDISTSISNGISGLPSLQDIVGGLPSLSDIGDIFSVNYLQNKFHEVVEVAAQSAVDKFNEWSDF